MTNSNVAVAVAVETSVALTVANAVIFEMAKTAGGSIQDDHVPGRKIVLKGLATLDRNGKQTVVALCAGMYFCLNRVYKQGEEVHLSRDSVGGVVKLMNKETMAEAVAVYNKDQLVNPWSSGDINNVVMF